MHKNIAPQRTEKYRLRSITMIGGAHMLEAITAPSCSDEYSDSSAKGSSSSSGDSDGEEEEEREETVSSKDDVRRLQQLCI